MRAAAALAGLLLLVLGLVLAAGCGRVVGEEYELVWQDEFSAEELDESAWTPQEDCWGGGNEELQCYTAREENVYMVNGSFLALHARREYYEMPLLGRQGNNCTLVDSGMRQEYCNATARNYTSGRIVTEGNSELAWTYARVEVRAKLPKGQGLWPAIWLLPRDKVYGYWPSSGEIDIMESQGQHSNKVEGTIHYSNDDGSHAYSGSTPTQFVCVDDFADDWHVFSVDWSNRESMVWRVDDVVYHTETLRRNFSTFYDEPGQPWDQAFYVLLNVAVGGGYLEDPTPASAANWTSPRMLVDYVRVFQRANGTDSNNDGGATDDDTHPARWPNSTAGDEDHCKVNRSTVTTTSVWTLCGTLSWVVTQLDDVPSDILDVCSPPEQLNAVSDVGDLLFDEYFQLHKSYDQAATESSCDFSGFGEIYFNYTGVCNASQIDYTGVPTVAPTASPTTTPSASPNVSDANSTSTTTPTTTPATTPTTTPTSTPTSAPTATPTATPTSSGTLSPTAISPTAEASNNSSTANKTASPTPAPTTTKNPSAAPTASPSTQPTRSSAPSLHPVATGPSVAPTGHPIPTAAPTTAPSPVPTVEPSTAPSVQPTSFPSLNPSQPPPTQAPSLSPTTEPSSAPTLAPTPRGTWYELDAGIDIVGVSYFKADNSRDELRECIAEWSSQPKQYVYIDEVEDASEGRRKQKRRRTQVEARSNSAAYVLARVVVPTRSDMWVVQDQFEGLNTNAGAKEFVNVLQDVGGFSNAEDVALESLEVAFTTKPSEDDSDAGDPSRILGIIIGTVVVFVVVIAGVAYVRKRFSNTYDDRAFTYKAPNSWFSGRRRWSALDDDDKRSEYRGGLEMERMR